MIAIFWKECREHFKWAMFALIGLGLAQGYALFQMTDPAHAYALFGNPAYDYESICSAMFLQTTTFGYAIVGLGLGMLQIFPEMKADRWAFLVHRPVTRTTIFAGKALAGITLYLFAILPVFLAVVWWVKTPGHIAGPFTAGMMIPAIIDMAVGIIFYFAGLLVALREAHWLGSKVVPIMAAIYCSVVAARFWDLGELLTYLFWIGLAMIGAAWGAFLTRGVYASQPLVARIAQAIVLAWGFWLIAIYGDTILSSIFRPPPDFDEHDRYILTQDGNVIIAVDAAGEETRYTDLSGLKLSDPRLQDSRHRNDLLVDDTQLTNGFHLPGEPQLGGSYRSINRYLILNESINDSRSEPWFYIPVLRTLEQFRRGDKMPLGYVGPGGREPVEGPIPSFAEPLLEFNGNVLLFAQTVYHFNFPKGVLNPIALTEKGDGLVEIALLSVRDQNFNQKRITAVAFENDIRFVADDGTILCRVSYRHNPHVYGLINVAVANNLQSFYVWFRPMNDEVYAEDAYIDAFKPTGEFIRETALHPFPRPTEHHLWWKEHEINLRAFVLLIWNRLEWLVAGWTGDTKTHDYWTKLIQSEGNQVAFLFGRAIPGMACAPIAWWFARRALFPLRRQILWTLIVFAIGPFGLLMFFAIHDWPRLIPCPSCGKKRRLDQEECPHCHAPWPDAASKGIEIFEEDTLVTK